LENVSSTIFSKYNFVNH